MYCMGGSIIAKSRRSEPLKMKRLIPIIILVFLATLVSPVVSISGELEDAQEQVRLNPNDAKPHYGLGMAYYRLEQYQDAIAPFKEAIRINPNDAKPHHVLGMTFFFLEQYQDAIGSYKEAIRIKPNHTNAHYWLGSTYLELGQYQDAIKWLRLSADQGNDDAQVMLANLYAHGTGVQTDHQEAFKWISLAAKQGNAKAQLLLGLMYFEGKGISQDYQEAFKIFSSLAQQGNKHAQFVLGEMYAEGKGLIKNYVEAHKWLNIAAAKGTLDAGKRRDRIERKMTPYQISEAQRLAQVWMNKPKLQKPPAQIEQEVASGTGFLFSSKNYVITNYHVVEEASSILVKFVNWKAVKAEVIASDKRNDIAILKLASAPPLLTVPIKLGDSSSTRMGNKIFTIGYPASDIMGERPKYSEGVINALTGAGDDPTFFQISVPIQPGNSGGPLFNEKGEVIGITSASLSLETVDAMGAIPQNVNYAIKSSFLKNLLSTIPDLMAVDKGIVVIPKEPEELPSNFVERLSKNIVLIEVTSN